MNEVEIRASARSDKSVSPSLSELMREFPIEKLGEMKNMLLKMQDAEQFRLLLIRQLR